MPPKKKKTQAATATKQITNTQIALAVAALFVAGSAALAAGGGRMSMKTNSSRMVKSVACQDSDGGINYPTNGWVTYLGKTTEDSCYTFGSGKTYLFEGACVNDKYVKYQKNCKELGSEYSCVDGACVATGTLPFVCNDTDGGVDYNTKGVATGYIINPTTEVPEEGFSGDTCMTATSLLEAQCGISDYYKTLGFPEGSEFVSTMPYDCADEGKICENGACVATGTEPFVCTDSDDGIDYTTFGIVQDEEKTVEDSCYTFGSGKTYLFEGVCKDNKYVRYQKNCAELGSNFVCQEGVCVEEEPPIVASCDETDDGHDKDNKGTISYTDALGSSDKLTDFCLSPTSTYLNEYYCTASGTPFASDLVNCASYGQECVNGECVEPEPVVCNDTDGGYNIYEQGTATNPSGSQTDYCIEESWGWDRLIEFSCNATGTIISKHVICDGACNDGTCPAI